MTNNVMLYVSKYIQLCSQLCKIEEDYTKEKVAINNKAMINLNKLRQEMHKNIELTENVYSELLKNEDSYIRESAATDCLYLNIHTQESMKILKWTCKHGDRMAAMEAKRTILIWRGKLNPEDPF